MDEARKGSKGRILFLTESGEWGRAHLPRPPVLQGEGPGGGRLDGGALLGERRDGLAHRRAGKAVAKQSDGKKRKQNEIEE